MDQVIAAAGPLWEKMLQPVMLAVLNTAPEEGSMDLAGAVVRESLALGGMASRPRIAEPTPRRRLRRAGAGIPQGQGRRGALAPLAQGHRDRRGKGQGPAVHRRYRRARPRRPRDPRRRPPRPPRACCRAFRLPTTSAPSSTPTSSCPTVSTSRPTPP
ncbi:MAG: hypothetical protein WDN45_02565 [Caulobacteraceae bacterium]